MLSPRENMIRAFRHEETEYLPFSLTDFTGAFLPIGDTPRPTSDGRYVDGWGVQWLRQEIGNMPNEAVPPVVEDICDWRDYLRFPDLDALDWEKMGAETQARWQNDNRLRCVTFFNGVWERFYLLCGFENALCYLLTDPDEAAEMIDAIAQFRVETVRRLGKYFKPDKILMLDDYGSSDRLMMSAPVWREIIKPALKKVVDATHKEGILYEHHSCGFVAPLMDDLVELGVDGLQPVGIANDPISIKQKYGSKITVMGGFDIQNVFDNHETTYEQAYENALYMIERLAPGGSYIVHHPSMVRGPNYKEVNRGLVDAINEYDRRCGVPYPLRNDSINPFDR